MTPYLSTIQAGLRRAALPVFLTISVPACAQQAGPASDAGAAAPIAPPATALPAGSAAERPTLLLFLTVDQLRTDYLQVWHDQLTGGLRLLVDQGAFFVEGVHDHAITETAPGHASTMSGRFPYSTGIASNSAGVNTNTAPLLATEGVGASPFRFQGSTLVDWMVERDPSTRVLSVSRKDRGAILPIGRGKHPVFWYAQLGGIFTTSTWYGDTLPTWVRAFNAEDRAVTRYAGKEWNLLLPESAYPEPDSVPAEARGQGFVFPHVMPTDSALARNTIAGQPWMDEMILDFAWRGVREMDLGAGPRTDVLAVSLSTLDAVGHRWGPDSREVHDMVLRVDRMLGTFLDSLFALRGRENVVIALTGDHGVAPIVGVPSRFGDNRRAVALPRGALDPVYAAIAPLVQRSGVPPDAFSMDWPVFEVDRAQAQGKDREVREIARAFAREVRKVPGVLRADVIDDLARADTVRDDIARRWLHMFRPGGQALVGVTLTPFSYSGGGIVATHGTPHDYDAKVPVIFWGDAFRATHDSGKARVVDMAPTLARLLGVTPGEKLDGVVLGRAFREPRD